MRHREMIFSETTTTSEETAGLPEPKPVKVRRVRDDMNPLMDFVSITSEGKDEVVEAAHDMGGEFHKPFFKARERLWVIVGYVARD